MSYLTSLIPQRLSLPLTHSDKCTLFATLRPCRFEKTITLQSFVESDPCVGKPMWSILTLNSPIMCTMHISTIGNNPAIFQFLKPAAEQWLPFAVCGHSRGWTGECLYVLSGEKASPSTGDYVRNLKSANTWYYDPHVDLLWMPTNLSIRKDW